jgi:hypothetical protein
MSLDRSLKKSLGNRPPKILLRLLENIRTFRGLQAATSALSIDSGSFLEHNSMADVRSGTIKLSGPVTGNDLDGFSVAGVQVIFPMPDQIKLTINERSKVNVEGSAIANGKVLAARVERQEEKTRIGTDDGSAIPIS